MNKNIVTAVAVLMFCVGGYLFYRSKLTWHQSPSDADAYTTYFWTGAAAFMFGVLSTLRLAVLIMREDLQRD